jgi:hypothetical protein
MYSALFLHVEVCFFVHMPVPPGQPIKRTGGGFVGAVGVKLLLSGVIHERLGGFGSSLVNLRLRVMGDSATNQDQ